MLGYLSRLFLGQFVGAMAERLIQTIPGIGGFYNSVKQFIETFGAKDRTQFSKVVLVQFPRAGAWSIGFVTNTGRGEPHAHLKADHWAVFVPTCPSPVNGFFMYLPVAEVVELDMSGGRRHEDRHLLRCRAAGVVRPRRRANRTRFALESAACRVCRSPLTAYRSLLTFHARPAAPDHGVHPHQAAVGLSIPSSN